MRRTGLVIPVLAVLAVTLSAALGEGGTAAVPSSTPAAACPSSVVAAAAEYDFGTVRSGTAVEHDFVIENRGTSPAKILQVRTSCGCTVGQASVSDIPPGGASKVHIRFDTSGRTGRQHKSIYVQTNDPVQPVLTCQIQGDVAAFEPGLANPATSPAASLPPSVPAAPTAAPAPTGVPRLEVAERQHDFGAAPRGAKLEHPFLFRNTGQGRVTFSNVRTSADWLEPIVRPMVLDPGYGGRVWVIAKTAKLTGPQSGTVTVATTDPQLPELSLAVKVDVTADSAATGTGSN